MRNPTNGILVEVEKLQRYFDVSPPFLNRLIERTGKVYVKAVDGITFSTPVRHIHPVETYGLVFQTPRHSFAYITDTRYFDGLSTNYLDSELIIVNVVLIEPRPFVSHLSVPEARDLIAEIKPKIAILNHFGMGVWKARPWQIAEKLSEETGVRVIAAKDGMKFDLSQLDEG